MEADVAAFTIKQLAALGVGSLVVIALGLWIWYLIAQCRQKDSTIKTKDAQIIDLMDKLVNQSHSSQEYLQPVLSAMTGVEKAMDSINTIIHERLPRR